MKLKFSIPANSKYGKILTGLFILIGLGLSVKGFFVYNEDKESENWPQATGIIINSSVGEEENDEGKISYFADIKFKYFVNNISYTNDRISRMVYIDSDQSKFEQTLLKYPLNKIVTIYYNPDYPKQGYLEPGLSFGSYMYLIFGLAFIIISMANYLISKFVLHKKVSS